MLFESDVSRYWVIGLSVGVSAAIVSVFLTVFGVRYSRRKKRELDETQTKYISTKTELDEERKAWLIDWNNIDRRELISKGAFGEVWKCFYNRKECVVKVLKLKKVIKQLLQLCA